MRIGYFGGSFDPPHQAHLAVACAARDGFALDKVLLVPTGRQPFKPEGAAASFADRLAMTKLLCAGQAGLQASALDAPHPDNAPNFTVDALRTLRQDLPAASEVFMIVGADTFLGVRQWREGAALLEDNSWIVVSRPGVSQAEIEASLLPAAGRLPRLHLLTQLADPTSATALRDRLREGSPVSDQLTAPVEAYIRQHGLYVSR